jgi:Dyp-type peroxidase family
MSTEPVGGWRSYDTGPQVNSGGGLAAKGGAVVTVIAPRDRRDIQGLIATGYGHLDHAGFLFLRVSDGARARDWLRALIPQVTTAERWPKDADGRKDRPPRPLNLAFSSSGFAALGLPEESLAGFSTEFVAGMPSRASVLGDWGDSDPNNWELGGPTNPALHMLAIVHGADDDAVYRRLAQLKASCDGAGIEEVTTERGERAPRSREHFGFAADGISEPLIEGLQEADQPGTSAVKTGEFVLGYRNEFGVYPASPAVHQAHDRHGMLPPFPDEALPDCRDFGRNGTYLVYRKLLQDVAGFWRFVQEICSQPPVDPAVRAVQMRLVASKFMGRWPSGAPLVMAPHRDDLALGTRNDFLYRPTDEDGLACPVGAHIRRANPRDSLKRVRDTAADSIKSSNQHRILRRGVPFGPPLFAPATIENGGVPVDLQHDDAPRGLHFVALNADPKRQFEFIQQTWINNPSFNGLYDNKDPILGDNDGSGNMTIQRRPVRATVRGIPRFVSVRGGAYWFVPSISALRYLAECG